MHDQTRKINRAIASARKEFDEKCVVCAFPTRAGCHILPRGSHKEFADVEENIVILCGVHHKAMDDLKPRKRLGWLLKKVTINNFVLSGEIGVRLLKLCEEYKIKRGGELTIE